MSYPQPSESAFVELVGSPGRAKMLEAFLAHQRTKLTASDLADIADISESTVSRNIDRLIEYDVIEVADEIGQTTLYQVNDESQIAECFDRVQRQLREKIVANASGGTDSESTADSTAEHGETTAAQRLTEIVPRLFAMDDESERASLAAEIESLADDDPSAATRMAPVLRELTDDDNEAVATTVQRILAGTTADTTAVSATHQRTR